MRLSTLRAFASYVLYLDVLLQRLVHLTYVSYVRAFRALIVRLHIFLVWICNRPKTIFQGQLKTLQIVLFLFVWVGRPTWSFLRRWNFLNIFKKLNHFSVLVFVLSFQP